MLLHGDASLGLALIEESVQKSFDVFFDKGLLGAFVVLLLIGLSFAGLIIRFLYNEGRLREKEYAAVLERIVTLTESTKNTTAANTAIIDKLGAVVDSLRTALEEHGHEIERNSSDLRHSMANNGMSLTSIAEILRNLRDEVSRGARDRGA